MTIKLSCPLCDVTTQPASFTLVNKNCFKNSLNGLLQLSYEANWYLFNITFSVEVVLVLSQVKNINKQRARTIWQSSNKSDLIWQSLKLIDGIQEAILIFFNMTLFPGFWGQGVNFWVSKNKICLAKKIQNGF